jgi:hypothetical protein
MPATTALTYFLLGTCEVQPPSPGSESEQSKEALRVLTVCEMVDEAVPSVFTLHGKTVRRRAIVATNAS